MAQMIGAECVVREGNFMSLAGLFRRMPGRRCFCGPACSRSAVPCLCHHPPLCCSTMPKRWAMGGWVRGRRGCTAIRKKSSLPAGLRRLRPRSPGLKRWRPAGCGARAIWPMRRGWRWSRVWRRWPLRVWGAMGRWCGLAPLRGISLCPPPRFPHGWPRMPIPPSPRASARWSRRFRPVPMQPPLPGCGRRLRRAISIRRT